MIPMGYFSGGAVENWAIILLYQAHSIRCGWKRAHCAARVILGRVRTLPGQAEPERFQPVGIRHGQLQQDRRAASRDGSMGRAMEGGNLAQAEAGSLWPLQMWCARRHGDR